MQKNDAQKSYEHHCVKDGQNMCPFTGSICKKISKTKIGICTLFHRGHQQIICPNYFYKFDFLKIVANKILNTTDYYVIKEFKIFDNFIDFILVDKNNYANYCAIELQALDTTGNYQWLFGEKVKPFCINWKTTKKTIIAQLIAKIPVFKTNNKKVVLVIQNTFLNYLKIDDKHLDYDDDLFILALCEEVESYELISLSFSQLQKLLVQDFTDFDLDKRVIDRLQCQ